MIFNSTQMRLPTVQATMEWSLSQLTDFVKQNNILGVLNEFSSTNTLVFYISEFQLHLVSCCFKNKEPESNKCLFKKKEKEKEKKNLSK